MSERADQIIAALRSGHDHLASLVRCLGAADLTRQSRASVWDVSQVLSHLGSGAEIGLTVLEGALDGTGPKNADFNRSVWARWTREDLRIDLGFLPMPVDLATVAGLRLNESTSTPGTSRSPSTLNIGADALMARSPGTGGCR
ncbi:maleylpyruvate isomerase N-terminal domain-containing protein [Streptomyces sp. NPDC002787]